MGIGQREVLMNSSENVGSLDLNNMQRFLRAFCADWMLGQSGSFVGAGDPGAAGFDRTKALFCLGDSGAPYPTATARQVTNLAGPIVQWKTGVTFPLASPGGSLPTNWGMDMYALVYWLHDGELITVHSVGDATNPRWDLVCVKLDDISNDVADQETRLQKQVVIGPPDTFVISNNDFIKRRKVTMTKQVVAGTPAGSPTIPAVPAGYQPLYAVLVPATFNAAFPVDDNFHDYRMPLGSFCVDIQTLDALQQNGGVGGGVAIGAGGIGQVFLTGAVNYDLVPRMPVAGHSCRLIGVSALTGQNSGGGVTVSLGRYNVSAAGTYNALGGNSNWTIAALNATSGGAANFAWITARLATQAGNSPPAVAAKPPWGNGRASGYASRADQSTADNFADMLGIRYAIAGGTTFRLSMVRFHFAGMPF